MYYISGIILIFFQRSCHIQNHRYNWYQHLDKLFILYYYFLYPFWFLSGQTDKLNVEPIRGTTFLNLLAIVSVIFPRDAVLISVYHLAWVFVEYFYTLLVILIIHTLPILSLSVSEKCRDSSSNIYSPLYFLGLGKQSQGIHDPTKPLLD